MSEPISTKEKYRLMIEMRAREVHMERDGSYDEAREVAKKELDLELTKEAQNNRDFYEGLAKAKGKLRNYLADVKK
jgi:hypothetical protein